MSHPRRTVGPLRLLAVVGAAALVTAGCTSNSPDTDEPTGTAQTGAASDNDAPGEEVVIGFSGPAADHGWLAAINSSAQEEAAKYSDVDFRQAEGTNDASLQISQIETFINDGVDAIVLLPTDGAALTEVATKAMEAGIIVVNVDREFSSPFAARTTVLGDNAFTLGLDVTRQVLVWITGLSTALSLLAYLQLWVRHVTGYGE